MNRRALLLAIALWCCPGSVTEAQLTEEQNEKGISFGSEHVTRWRVGVVIKAVGGPCKGLLATIPVPTDWPEQEVKIIEEDVSPSARVSRRDLEGVLQLMIRIPMLRSGETAKAVYTYEVRRKEIEAPADTSDFVIPKKLPRDVRQYLAASPYIEIRNRKIRSLAKEVVGQQESAWAKVEAIYDHVRDHVEYREGKLKGAVAALRDGYGDCEELSSLIIALCRANKIPARTVWIPDHCYPEFYLEDDEGKGHWFPCQAAGTRAFGSMPERRPILQKGDNFKVPEKKERQRYVAEFLQGAAIRGGGRPEVDFIREYVSN